MRSREEIFEHLKTVMAELFETDAARIKPESRLYEDLDIDSIDAIDLVLELKKYTGKKVQPEAFKNVRSVDDVIDAVQALLAE